MNKQTVIIITASTALGFIGDVLTYSIAASKQDGFKLHVPKGKDLALVLISGIVGGYLIDLAVKKISRAASTEAENSLDDAVDSAKAKIAKGELASNMVPTIVWMPKVA